jgi:hypothetical protein
MHACWIRHYYYVPYIIKDQNDKLHVSFIPTNVYYLTLVLATQASAVLHTLCT